MVVTLIPGHPGGRPGRYSNDDSHPHHPATANPTTNARDAVAWNLHGSGCTAGKGGAAEAWNGLQALILF